jgi:hypothetical protein
MAVPVEVMGAIQAIGQMVPNKQPVQAPQTAQTEKTPLSLGDSFKLAGQTAPKVEEPDKQQQKTQG